MKRTTWNLADADDRARFQRYVYRKKATDYKAVCDTCLPPTQAAVDHEQKSLLIGANAYSRLLSNELEHDLAASDFPFTAYHACGHVTWGDTNIPFLTIRLEWPEEQKNAINPKTGEPYPCGPFIDKDFASYFLERAELKRLENVTSLQIGKQRYPLLADVQAALPDFHDQFGQITHEWNRFDEFMRGNNDQLP